MSNTTTRSTLFARRVRPTTQRWHELQAQLSAAVTSDASRWSRRSFVSCRWLALPADVSAAAPLPTRSPARIA